MKAKDIRNLTTTEIEKEIKEAKEQLFNLRFQLATGQLEETANIRKVKRRLHVLKQSFAKEKSKKRKQQIINNQVEEVHYCE